MAMKKSGFSGFGRIPTNMGTSKTYTGQRQHKMDLDIVNVLDDYYLLITLLPTIVYQLFFFTIAWRFKFDKVTDLAGGTNFVWLAILTLSLRAGADAVYSSLPTRNLVASVFVILWGVRLAGYLFWRILKTGKDARFDKIRGNFWKFLGFWVFQMIWVWTVSLPVTILNSPSSVQTGIASEFGTPLDIIGTIFFITGLSSEVIADSQKWNFRSSIPLNQPKGSYPFIQSGLFRYSRHPNYFGEILLWIGIYLLCLSPVKPVRISQVLTLFSPLLTAFLLMFVSGLPIQEKPAARKRYNWAEKDGGEGFKEYKAYLDRTSILIPFPPSVYSKLPLWIKETVLLDFSIYRFDPVKGAKAKKDNGPSTEPDAGQQVDGSSVDQVEGRSSDDQGLIESDSE